MIYLGFIRIQRYAVLYDSMENTFLNSNFSLLVGSEIMYHIISYINHPAIFTIRIKQDAVLFDSILHISNKNCTPVGRLRMKITAQLV